MPRLKFKEEEPNPLLEHIKAIKERSNSKAIVKSNTKNKLE
jgi:hypothetical protein